MTRVSPTAAEEIVRGELVKLLGVDHIKFVPRETEDNPDFLFNYKNRLIACEATQIPPSSVFRYVHKHLYECPKDRAIGVRVIWPEEPHSWVAAAVKAKRDKIVRYKKETGATQCWLLIHTPVRDDQIFVRGDFPWERQMLRYGASHLANGFEKILFWEPRSGLQVIHRRGERAKRVEFDLTKGYPSRSFTTFSAPFTTTQEGEPPREYDFGEIEMVDIKIPPMDTDFVGLEPAGRRWNYRLRIVAHATHAESFPEIIRVN